jgi:hypothetical protein
MAVSLLVWEEHIMKYEVTKLQAYEQYLALKR